MKLKRLEVFRDGLGRPPLVFGPEGSGAEAFAREAWYTPDGGLLHVTLPGGVHLTMVGVPFILTQDP